MAKCKAFFNVEMVDIISRFTMNNPTNTWVSRKGYKDFEEMQEQIKNDVSKADSKYASKLESTKYVDLSFYYHLYKAANERYACRFAVVNNAAPDDKLFDWFRCSNAVDGR